MGVAALHAGKQALRDRRDAQLAATIGAALRAGCMAPCVRTPVWP
jgi:hypothetical protein